ncbi:Rne/Rng family ribonuclease [Neobacillus niacini]|uniref:Rne/Rng family ribonuclease n=1 Tax=Neobacillus niacini TaxID=86668 RepID=UPI00052FA6FE|nr:Rne/Rng family ribonuclease [Neobacillus niacini]KGM45540.1 axial filament protein [Neobacillus niacini]MEC1521802.1 Rne/Rng family ribonuclease [Neobacillus niacini]
MDKLIINAISREKRFAVVKNNTVEEIIFDRPEQRSLVGDIYYGTVTKVLPGMNAAFIDIGEEKNAYLHRDVLASYVLSPDRSIEKEKKSVSSFVHQGEKLIVQVDKDATGPKGARVTGIVELLGDNLIYMPQGRYVAVSKKIVDEKDNLRSYGTKLKSEEEGLIFRTSSTSATYEEMVNELSTLRSQYTELLEKAASFKKPGILYQKDTFTELVLEYVMKMSSGEVFIDDLSIKQLIQSRNPNLKVTYYNGKENIFTLHRIEHEIDKALKRIVWLDNGAYLIFDETEALTIIDVNTGKFSGKNDYQDTVVKTNTLAAIEIARQLKLRDLGGIVLIDFIDMKNEKDKRYIQETIEKEFQKDKTRTKIMGFTSLGILQLTRKKTKVSLSEALQEKCPVCEGTGKILSADTIAFRLERELLEHRNSDAEAVLIETTLEVKLAIEPHLDMIEEWMKFKVCFSIQSSATHYYVIKQFGNLDEIAQKAGESY